MYSTFSFFQKKDKISAMLADEALVAEIVHKYLQHASAVRAATSTSASGGASCGAGAGEMKVGGMGDGCGRRVVVEESVIRERLRLLALQVEEEAGEGVGGGGGGGGLRRLLEKSEVVQLFDPRDIEADDMVHNKMILDLDGSPTRMQRARALAAAERARKSDREGVSSRAAEHVLRPGKGGLLHREEGEGGVDSGEAQDEVGEEEEER